MTRPIAKTLLFALAAVAVAASPAFAQVNDQVQSADTSRAIVIKAPKTPKESKPQTFKFVGEVLSSNIQSITVRGGENERQVRTFTYGPEIRDKMQALFERGGYQYGDKVTIESQPNSDVALSVKGKPSKSL
jgi:hypothetical protein